MKAGIDYLDRGHRQTETPYGCHNKERPINGAPVKHNHTGPVIANTVWLGSNADEPVRCHYTEDYPNDPACSGCRHQSNAPAAQRVNVAAAG